MAPSRSGFEDLEIPVLGTYRVFGGPDCHVSALGGVSIGWRLRAKARASFGDDTLEQDITDDVKSSDFAVVGGAAYHRGRLVIEGRYTFGFTDLDEDDDVHGEEPLAVDPCRLAVLALSERGFAARTPRHAPSARRSAGSRRSAFGARRAGRVARSLRFARGVTRWRLMRCLLASSYHRIAIRPPNTARMQGPSRCSTRR